jgi:hypothetical protein
VSRIERTLRRVDRPLPMPPDIMRQGPLREGSFRSGLHDPKVAAQLGTALGLSFSICFLTGLFSHYLQHPPWGFVWPSRPVSLYRVTQGVHVATGIASVPLLLAKLWTVYPMFWAWPPARSLLHVVERGSVFLLVGSSVFQLYTGLANISRWYFFGFFFTPVHFFTSFVAIGSLMLHIGAKATIARHALRPPPGTPAEPSTDAMSRRGFVTAVGVAAGAVTVATVGETVTPLDSLSVLSPRRPHTGPQHLPVNKSARYAGVTDSAVDPSFALVVDGPRPVRLTLADLRAMRQYVSHLPITCVEGWSVGATWSGIRVRDLADLVGARPDAAVRVESLEQSGLYRSSVLGDPHVRDPLTLLAMTVNGDVLSIDHGYPLRLIAPNRPGVMQTKWVNRLVIL